MIVPINSQLFRLLKRLFAVALALLPAALPAATQIHISPTGNDANSGTVALPVRTPQGAQVRVRALVQAGRVWIHHNP